MSNETRAAGWYSDPWGTGDERYFDGVAWARTTRLQGDTGAVVPGSFEPIATAPTEATPTAPPAPSPPEPLAPPTAESTPFTVPAGWYADPWGASAFRYWDGRQWTGHISGLPGVQAQAPRLDDERAAGRWAKVGLAWGGLALAVSTIAGAVQWHWVADHWDELTASGNDVPQNPNGGAALAGQLAGLVLLVVGVLFLLWFHRAATNAASAGMPARRRPGLATASFIIPILNFWWPYQSTCDLLPPDHPGRVAVRRWWALWIGCTIAGLAIAGAALTLNDVALAITTSVGVVLAVLAALAARTVVDQISEAHGQLLARAA